MIRYFKNGVLEVQTLDLPQDCGDIKVTLSVEEELEEGCYYLEFSCPRNVKYISQRLQKVADGEFELVLPRGISEYMGEVYVQLVIMSKTEARLISRSLIARDPLFVIKESILASSALESSDRRDFFEYAAFVVANAQSKIDVVDSLVEDMPNIVEGKVEGVVQNILNSIEDCDNEIQAANTRIDSKISKSQIAQTTGQSEEDVMSQKAVSDRLYEKIDKTAIAQEAGTSTTKIMSQKTVCDGLNTKVDKTAIVQKVGASPNNIISQKVVSDELAQKVDKTSIVQSAGQSTSSVMSQKSVTTALSQAMTKYFRGTGGTAITIDMNNYSGDEFVTMIGSGFGTGTGESIISYVNGATKFITDNYNGFVLSKRHNYISLVVFSKTGALKLWQTNEGTNNVKIQVCNLFGHIVVLSNTHSIV